jgi:hypothetical protein
VGGSNWFGYLDEALPRGTPRWLGRVMAIGLALSLGGLALMAVTAVVWVILEATL